MALGGAREGAGRKSVAAEMRSRELCVSALTKKFGSMEGAIDFLLKSGEPSLLKFVYEHALGKPKEEIELMGKKVTIKVSAE
jgi:hypothetical protein